MTDHFVQDAARREALADELVSLRVSLLRAVENADAQLALRVATRALLLLEGFPDAQVFCVGDHESEHVSSVILRPSARAMPSRYDGWCSECGNKYTTGAPIWWDPKTRTVTCVRCGGLPEGM